MKKLFLTAFAVFAFVSINAQQFGALAGFSSLNAKVEFGDDDDSESESGFFVGAFAEFELSEQFGVQPELTYTSAGDVSLISLNIIGEYSISDEFTLQAGPQIGLVGGDAGEFIDEFDDGSKLNLQLAVGASYDITEEFFVQARYGFQLNDHYTGDADSASFKISGFSVGFGYNFGG